MPSQYLVFVRCMSFISLCISCCQFIFAWLCSERAYKRQSTIQLISQLSPTLESKSVFVSERGLTSTQWSEYSAGTKRLQYSTVPSSAITAETVTVTPYIYNQMKTIYAIFTFVIITILFPTSCEYYSHDSFRWVNVANSIFSYQRSGIRTN